MNQHQLIIQRDFYYKREITAGDRIKFAAVSIFAHVAVYFYTLYAVAVLLELWRGSAMYVVFEVLLTIPMTAVLPVLLVQVYLKPLIPQRYSLADDAAEWKRKAVSLMLPGEIVRFLLGLLPSAVFRYGTVTSPITMMLYTLVYANPTGKYDAIIGRGETSVMDYAVFLLIYLVYFALYETIILRLFRKRVTSHLRYLEGTMAEKEKYQHYGARKFDD